MASSRAATVTDYLEELPAERRAVVSRVRDVVLAHLPAGYQETMNWGMICYEIPLERYPVTYNRQPLAYAAIAAQKHHYSLYLMSVDQVGPLATSLKVEFEKAGKELDMGKSCVRFRTIDDLPLDVIGRVIASTTPEAYIAHYEASRR
ncbi:MAG TPA: DUF1801 domain-containing protein [Gemmatimonadaceae bacterium]|nr:DUF1801 domain-containing protein [Gemmatimonadaceae bacterium]